ncbi:metalloendopeptidase [Aureococcus anophagefferens]|nr:metalloendopeptidase [Aureococcus anophagefferens]
MALLLGALLAAVATAANLRAPPSVATAANLRAPPPSLLDTLKSYTRVDVAHADGAALGADESFRDAVRLRISGAGIDVCGLRRRPALGDRVLDVRAASPARGLAHADREGEPGTCGVDGRHYAPGAGGHDHGEGHEGHDHGGATRATTTARGEGHDEGGGHDHGRGRRPRRGREGHDHGEGHEATTTTTAARPTTTATATRPTTVAARAQRLAAGRVRRGATKYLGVVVFNDESRYATRGVDVEAHSAAVLDVVHSIYGDEAPFGL